MALYHVTVSRIVYEEYSVCVEAESEEQIHRHKHDIYNEASSIDEWQKYEEQETKQCAIIKVKEDELGCYEFQLDLTGILDDKD